MFKDAIKVSIHARTLDKGTNEFPFYFSIQDKGRDVMFNTENKESKNAWMHGVHETLKLVKQFKVRSCGIYLTNWITLCPQAMNDELDAANLKQENKMLQDLAARQGSEAVDGPPWQLTVRILEGRNLPAADSNGLSDPYVQRWSTWWWWWWWWWWWCGG